MIVYPTYDQVLDIHDKIIDGTGVLTAYGKIIGKTGGLAGILDDNLLHSCVEMIRNDLYYPDLESKVNHLVFSLAKNHCFRDGNKRTALAASLYFLGLNNIPGEFMQNYISIMERIILLTAGGVIDKNELKEVVIDLIDLGTLSEKTEYYYNRRLLGEKSSF